MINGIKLIDFDTILPFWRDRLWFGRISPIESHSAMLHLSTKYDMENFTLPAWYCGYYAGNVKFSISYFVDMENFTLPAWYCGYYVDDEIVGVNSGHMCADGSARSRGLWVCPENRKNGLGKQLLLATIDQAKIQGANSIWSYTRKTSWPTYESAGFALTSNWEQSETSEANAYCYLVIE